MDTTNTPLERLQPAKTVGKNPVTFKPGDLHDEEENDPNHHQPHNHHHTSTPLTAYQAGPPPTITKLSSPGMPKETHGAVTVSAEVLKLNEQIARVRQQLTSLCSTDQTDPSPSPGSAERSSRPKARSMQFDIHSSPPRPSQIDPHDQAFKKAKKLSPHDHQINGCRSTSSAAAPHYQDSRELAAAKSPREGQESPHKRRKPALNWADMGGALLNRSGLKQEQQQQQLAKEARSSSDHPFRARKAEKLPSSRPSARDSLGAASRPRGTNVSKKLKVRVPSVASSHSDIVCTHCRRYMTDEEENDNALPDSTPETMSKNPSPKLQTLNRPHRARELKRWQSFRNGDSSTASEEREAAHRHSGRHDCHHHQKFNPHGLPELAGGRWSDESDESRRPAGSALPRKCASVPSMHSNAAPRKPWLKGRDRRAAPYQHLEKGIQKLQGAKEEPQLSRKASSGPILRKRGAVGTFGKAVRKEKAFPANLRESVHSYQPELHQYRATAAHPLKIPV